MPSALPSLRIRYSIGLLDLRPEPLEERVVGRHLVFAVGAEDPAALAVVGRLVRAGQPGPHADAAVLVKADAEVDPFALDRVRSPGNSRPGRLGVVPDVRAGPVAAADPLPRPEPAVGEAVAGGRRQRRRVGHRAVEEPVGQASSRTTSRPSGGSCRQDGRSSRRRSGPRRWPSRSGPRTQWPTRRLPTARGRRSSGKCQVTTKAIVVDSPGASLNVAADMADELVVQLGCCFVGRSSAVRRSAVATSALRRAEERERHRAEVALLGEFSSGQRLGR